jgi:Putative metal-binding domain of cation transport ATPase
VATVKYGKKCDLCGLPVEIEGFTLAVDKGELWFCCAGCQSIYQLIYINGQSIGIDKKTKNNIEDSNK